jgi:hypothetical protein
MGPFSEPKPVDQNSLPIKEAGRGASLSRVCREIGRGGGDRILDYFDKSHVLTALQPPCRNNWYKQYKEDLLVPNFTVSRIVPVNYSKKSILNVLKVQSVVEVRGASALKGINCTASCRSRKMLRQEKGGVSPSLVLLSSDPFEHPPEFLIVE